MNTKGRIHSFETFGTVDGPGIRFILFMQGCPLKCKYCHNRDTWATTGGQEYTVSKIVKQIMHSKTYIDASKGGVTVSGGEPLLQAKFVTELFKKLKENDVNTCLDTSAGPYRDTDEYKAKFDELMKYTDLVLFDIKHADPKAHKDLTGITNDNILKCLYHLEELKKPVWIRHVLVPTITDSKENLEAIKKIIDSLTIVERVEVLPYHNLGVHKYEGLGIEYTLKDVPMPETEQVDEARKILGAI